MIPFDREFSEQLAEEFVAGRADRAARRRAGLGRRELPLRQGPRATPSCCARAPSSRRASCRWWRWTARPSPRATSAALVAAGDVAGRARVPGRPVPVRGRGGGGRPARPRARHADREHRARRRARRPRPRRLRGVAHGHPAAVNVGVRPTFDTGRGLLVEAHLIDFDGDLYGQTLRIAFLERLRGEKRFDGGGRARGADAPRRRGGARDLPLLLRFPADDADERTSARSSAKYGRADEDTGSTEVQVALLTARINELTEHLREHTQGPPLAPRPADAGRQAPPAAQVPPAATTSSATARSSSELGLRR